MTWQQLYIEAHQRYHALKYPDAFNAGHWPVPKLPKDPTDKQKESLNKKYKRWRAELENDNWKERYLAVHKEWFKKEYPETYKDGHYLTPKSIDVIEEKGLKDFIVNFINWSGGWATDMRKISGTMVKEAEQQESGTVLLVKKFKHTGVKKGLADVDSIVHGRACKWEVKIGTDRPSKNQLDRQQETRDAGGVYEFIHSPEEFLFFYDKIN